MGQIIWGIVTFCLFVFIAPLQAQDVIHLRNGGALRGNIVSETDEGYRVALGSGGSMTNLSRHAVAYVIYESSQKARRFLALSEMPQTFGAREQATIHFLPPEAFGEAILREAKNAKERVWILAYYISGASRSIIADFYGSLMEGASKRNLDVRVIAEFSSSTAKPIRHATLEFSKDLQAKSVKVTFMQERRTLHKKILLLDRDKVFLGSSNLTMAGVSMNDDFNVLVESPAFAEAVARDFLRLSKRAKPSAELKY
jgi:phosphatidylserine/phosphatidylglycerophosphate/cardiolipin synthase-like enzyme